MINLHEQSINFAPFLTAHLLVVPPMSNIVNKVSKVKTDEIAQIAFPSNELSDVIPSKGKLSLHSKYSCLLMKILAFDEDISF